jgi:hypothetical protein
VALREVPLEISWRGQHLTGILTEAIGGEAQPVCAVLTGAGALRRIGPNRAWVESARRWAALGVPTARIDLIGIGDADGDDGPETRCNRALYASDRLEQTRTVLDALAERGLPDRFVVGGLCSGAYAAVHAAEVDERVVGTLLINLYAFEWSDELVRERQTTHTVSALHGRAWRKLFRRGLRRKQIVAALGSLRPDRLRVATGRPVERAQRTAVLRSLDRLRDRDVRTLLLLSDGEPLRDQLRRMGALHERQRWPNLRIERIPSRDHMFRARPLQRHVHSRLDATIAAIVAEQTTGQETSSSLRTS